MRIKIASYALKDVLMILQRECIDEVTITKEDNDLILVINKKDLRPKVPIDCVVASGDAPAFTKSHKDS